MTFTYPAIFTPHEDGKGYHAEFPDLEDAIENARDAANNWITVELEEFDSDLPFSTYIGDIQPTLKEGQLVKMISVKIKLLPDND